MISSRRVRSVKGWPSPLSSPRQQGGEAWQSRRLRLPGGRALQL